MQRIGSGCPVVNGRARGAGPAEAHPLADRGARRIRVIADASSVATSRSRHCNRERAKTSAANTRRIKSAQPQPRPEGAAESSASSPLEQRERRGFELRVCGRWIFHGDLRRLGRSSCGNRPRHPATLRSPAIVSERASGGRPASSRHDQAKGVRRSAQREGVRPAPARRTACGSRE